MVLTAIIAEASTRREITTTPEWLVPVITAVTGLLGTIVGGVITYTSTRSADNRKEAALATRENNAHIKDVAVRFLVALSKQNIDSLKLEDFAVKMEARIDNILNRVQNPSDEKKTSEDQGDDHAANEYLAGLLRRSRTITRSSS